MALWFLYNASYTQLLDKVKKSTMTVGRLCYLCVEIWKTKTACFESKSNHAKQCKVR